MTSRDAKTRERDRLRKAAYRAAKRGQPPVSPPVPIVPPVPEHPAKNKRTPERYQAILMALEVGNTRRAAAAAADITSTTFYEWIALDRALADAVLKAESKAEQRFLGQVATAAARNWQAAAWWLERRKHEDFGRRDHMDMAIDLRREVARMAKENDLDEAAVMAEVQSILAGRMGDVEATE